MSLSKRLEKLEKAANPEEITIRVVWDDEPAEPGDLVIEWDEPREEANNAQ